MILDDQLHEDNYLVQEGVIYHHSRIFFSKSSKLKEKLLQGAYEEFCFSHTYSMKIYKIIMRRFYWEGFEGELHQHFQEFMNHVELGQQYDSMKELFQPSLPSFERGERSMHHCICIRRIVGEGHTHVNHVLFSDCIHYFTIFMQAMAPRRSNISCKLHGQHWATKISVDTSSTLPLLGILDPYWKSQLLVDYSKDLHTCMILDDQLHEEGYLVQEGVIYHHGRIFLSRASKLKKKLLQRAYKEFCFSHMYPMRIYNIIMRSFDWEGLKEELHQHFQ